MENQTNVTETQVASNEANTEIQSAATTEAKPDPFETIVKNGNTYQGTVTQFIQAGVKLNGMKMDSVSLSALGRYKLIPQVGERKSIRGRPAAVYEIESGKGGFEL